MLILKEKFRWDLEALALFIYKWFICLNKCVRRSSGMAMNSASALISFELVQMKLDFILERIL